MCAIFQNEAAWLKEWIEYHRIVGFDHFLLYNNNSKDEFWSVLDPFIQQGVVEVIDWPTRPGRWVWDTQNPSILDALERLKGRSEWVAVLDLDEFLVPVVDPDVPTWLARLESTHGPVGGCFVNWLRYGTSQVWDLAPGETMIERLTWHAPFGSPDYNGKMVVRPEAVADLATAHDFIIDASYRTLCPDGSPYRPYVHGAKLANGRPYHIPRGGHDRIAVINHYELKTERYYREEKVPKKIAMDGGLITKYELLWALLNSVHSRGGPIQRFVPELKERLFGNGGLPSCRATHDGASQEGL